MTVPEVTTLHVRRLDPSATLPIRQHADDAGLDLSSNEAAVLQPGQRAMIGTGIAVAIPVGWVGMVCPRSGLAARHGIGIVNGPGIVDSGYRGELRVVLHNTDDTSAFTIEPGDRIAQLVLTPVSLAEVIEVETLSTAARSDAGFGSTGVRS